MAEMGYRATFRSLAVISLLLVQFFWPTLALWLGLLAFYLTDVTRVLAMAHVADDYVGVVFYLVPCFALLWVRPRLFEIHATPTATITQSTPPKESPRP